MDLAAKLQLNPGQSVSVVNEPDGLALDLVGDHPAAADPAGADAVT